MKKTPSDPRLRGSGKGWIWFGFGGHFCLNYRCAFHLATFLPKQKLFVSTIGAYLPKGSKKGAYETLGIDDDSYFETFVFESYGNGTEQDEMPSLGSQRYGKRLATSIEAEKHHYEVCWGLVDGALTLDV